MLTDAAVAKAESPAVGPYRVSANGRYIVDGRGNPFFVHGESAWSAIVNLSDADALVYLDDCSRRGFNAILVNLLEHKFAAKAPANANGVLPFSGAAFQSSTNGAYVAHIRWFVQAAAQRGIVLFANPAYLGYAGGSEGWQQELNAASASSAQAWGAYIGNELKSFGNVIWHLFGDFDPPSHAQTNAVQRGIAGSSPQYSLFSQHFARGASSFKNREPWLSWDFLYPPAVGYMHVETLAGYDSKPVIPQILGEAYYENDPQAASTEVIRRQAWGALTSGAVGHFYGNRHIWAFGNGFEPTNWKAALADPGRQQMQHVKAFFGARSWWKLQPDQSNTLLTAGRGELASAGYVTAALASDRSWAVAYLPSGAAAITVDRAVLSQPVQASWFNPRTGAYTQIGPLANSGLQKFQVPSVGDWVLVLEQKTAAAPASSSAPARGPVSPGTGKLRGTKP